MVTFLPASVHVGEVISGVPGVCAKVGISVDLIVFLQSLHLTSIFPFFSHVAAIVFVSVFLCSHVGCATGC